MITLEPVSLAHAAVLQALFEDPDVTEHLVFPKPYPPGEMARYIATAIDGRAAGTRYVFATIEPDGRPSGIALIKDVDQAQGTGEIGYAFGRAYWGGGRATAAAEAMAALGFDALRLRTLRAVCGALNLPSLRVLEKLGFTEERRYDRALPKWSDARVQIVFAQTRESWLAAGRRAC
jgi:RimJ/RimL family protein N-acetyltransferase